MKKKLIYLSLAILSFFIAFLLWKEYHKHQQQFPVLAYHRIVLTEEEKDVDALTVEEFERQLNYLKEKGYVSISPEEYYNWKEKNQKIPEKSFMITFDDGYYSFLKYAKPVLDKYHFKATSFVVGEFTGETSSEGTDFIGLNDIKNHDGQITFGSHTYGLHRQAEDGTPIIKKKTYQELREDTKKFQALFPAEYLAYPYYTYTEDFIKSLKEENYKLAFAGEEEFATKGVDNYKIPRIPASRSFEEFKKIFETDQFKNKYGNGLIRKICVTINRKLNISL